jgi:hypothetical protein
MGWQLWSPVRGSRSSVAAVVGSTGGRAEAGGVRELVPDLVPVLVGASNG